MNTIKEWENNNNNNNLFTPIFGPFKKIIMSHFKTRPHTHPTPKKFIERIEKNNLKFEKNIRILNYSKTKH